MLSKSIFFCFNIKHFKYLISHKTKENYQLKQKHWLNLSYYIVDKLKFKGNFKENHLNYKFSSSSYLPKTCSANAFNFCAK